MRARGEVVWEGGCRRGVRRNCAVAVGVVVGERGRSWTRNLHDSAIGKWHRHHRLMLTWWYTSTLCCCCKYRQV